MTKTLSERVLNITRLRGVFTHQDAKESFKEYDNQYVHNSIMRAARRLSSKGLLRRKSPGVYTLTNSGRKALA